MTIDLERELSAAMRAATSDIVAPPDLLDRVRPGRRSVRRRSFFGRPLLGAAAVAVAAVLTIVAGLYVVGIGTGGADRLTAAAAFADWGPTRGDLADDPAVRAALEAEWDHPTGHNSDVAGFDPVHGDRPMQVLWVGSTPDGPAAYAVQHTTDASQPWVYGVFIPDATRAPRLYYRMILDSDPAGSPWEPGPNLFSFASSRTPHAVVVVPTDPSALVQVSTHHGTDPDGLVVPQWQDVVPVDGAAVVTLTDPMSVFDTVIQVSRGGQLLARSRVQIIATDFERALPANGLGLWCNACAVIRGGGDLGTGESPWQAWTARHAPSWYPTMQSEWSAGGYLGGGLELMAVQLWLPGEPAHTVVGILSSGRLDRILLDEVTDLRARPLFAVRLPDGRGWFVGAGPNAVLTGWRVPGGQWTALNDDRAALVPDSPTVELRLVVAGRERVVTEGS
jgi:hypothetical protein